MDIIEKQHQIEKDAHDYSYSRFYNEISKRIKSNSGHELPESMLLIKLSIDLIANKIDEYFEAPLKGIANRERLLIYEWKDNTKGLALLLLNSLISSCSKDPYTTLIAMSKNIMHALKQHHLMLKLKQEQPLLHSYIEREYKVRGKGYIRSRKIKLAKMKTAFSEEIISATTLRVGTNLIDLVVKSGANLINLVKLKDKNKTTYVLSYTKEAQDLIANSRNLTFFNFQKFPIFVAPPKPWTEFHGSMGYYNKSLYDGYLIKSKGKNKKLLKQYFLNKEIKRYSDVVNRIQNTKWRINKNVLDVMNHIVDNNIVEPTSTRDNPCLIGGLPYCRHQSVEDYVNVYDYGEVHEEGKYKGMPKTIAKYKEWYKACEIQKEKILVNRSKAIMLFLALKDAIKFKDEPAIYFSYQADFRGRLYPIQQHLNPQLKGNIKCLLEFSEGVPIENEEQEAWFMVHGANCYGFDKLSYEERIDKICSYDKEIRDVVDNPIKSTFWTEADEPLLFLAWCYEYVAYKDNPTTFLSHIPIALDATCSGIQIYSGLLLDREGALAVNVIGQNRQDIYQKVADKVNNYLRIGDYSKTITFNKSDGTIHEVSCVEEAESLIDKVTRTFTKRNTMTQPYSVTKYGMYQQLIEVLDELEQENNVVWKGDKWIVARLLTSLNDRAIVETVKGARVGQEYLKAVTKEITKQGEYIFYTTPILDFPVLQKIHKSKLNRVSTQFGSLSLRSELPALDSIKMVNGIAPNYIHSLDATLMFLTVEKMKQCNSFHLIHDSFGVPINQVELLNESVRESYVELFQTLPLLKFIKQVAPHREEEVQGIMINTLDIEEVYDSLYIFS